MDPADDDLHLIALRPEPWRYRRLVDLLERVEAKVDDGGFHAEWLGALRRLADHKGDLTVVWSCETARKRFAPFVDEVWRQLDKDADEVLHQVPNDL